MKMRNDLTTDPILAFYLGISKDSEGRSLEDI